MAFVSRRTFVHQLGHGLGATLALPALEMPLVGTAPPARKLNVALCGLGRYATILASSLAASQHCQLAGIVTGTPRKAAQWQQQY